MSHKDKHTGIGAPDEDLSFSTGKKSTAIQTILDIWNVLAEHASPEHPLTISQIAEILEEEREQLLNANGKTKARAGRTDKERLNDARDDSLNQQAMASKKTVTRYLPDQIDAINTLYPHTVLCEQNTPSILHTYTHQDTLHVVVETKDGIPQWSGNMTAILKPSATNPIPEKTLNRKVPNLMSQFGEANQRSNRKPPLISLAGVMIKNPGSNHAKYVSALEYDMETGRAAGQSSAVTKTDMQKKEGRSPTRRFYLQSLLSPAEWRILSDLIKVYPYIDERQTEKFLSALQRMAPGIQKWSGKRYAHKMDAGMQFAHIEKLDQAIREQRQVSVTYGRYLLDKAPSGKLQPDLQPMPNHKLKGRPYIMTVEPYAMMWSNGYYYLVCKYGDGMRNLRLDRILNVALLTNTFEKDPQFDPYEYRDRSPVMYPGKPAHIRLHCPVSMLSTLMDFFGTTILDYSTPKESDTLPPDQRYTDVTLRASEAGTRLFALQYADQVEVLEPQSLREEVANTLRTAAEKYR